MCINFWRYKDAFPDLQSEMFSLPHIGAIILAIAIILVCALALLIYIPVAAIIVAFDKVLTRWICTK
jgi:hypothetical protein